MNKKIMQEIKEHDLTLNLETMSYYDQSGNEYRKEDGSAIFLEDTFDENDEDIEMLERENRNMAKKLKELGFTNEQISDICNK